MKRSLDALPAGVLLAVAGLVAVAGAGFRAFVAESVGPFFAIAVVPTFFAGGTLLVIGYRVRSLPSSGGVVIKWTAVGTVAVVVAADAVMVRARQLDVPIDPALVLLSVGAVGAAAAAAGGFLVTRDRIVQEEYRERTVRAERTLREASGFAVARLDPGGFVDEWSRGAAALTGYGADEILGTELDSLYADDADREAKQDLQRALKTDHVDLDGRFQRADGETFYGDGSLTAVEDGDGELLGYLLVLADREQERAEIESLQRRNDQLEAFASVVSHDLRNPLNVALGSIGMAQSLDDDQAKLETAEDALVRMENLIEEVLTLARQGEDVEEFERVDLEETVQMAWASVDVMWAKLETEDLPDITADTERVRRLFENLFRNAVEHGGEDVTIRIGALEDGFFVEDDGPGIPEHKRQEVFEAGYTTGDDGTGLGLSIVKSIVEAHGWDIEPAVGADGGARFEIHGVQTLAGIQR
jgi:PAS domain S-box-containing protein